MRKHTLFIIILLAIISSCSTGEKKYRIGVSQCSDDIWRDKQNTELKMAAYFHDNVELKFAAAYDSDQRQIQQIDSLVNEGIDLLIVAPNQIATISPAIDRTFEKGIPVIVFERKTNSRKYTAYMGADNYEMGKLMGEYIATRLQGKGKLMEVMGLKGSSPSIERHNGFRDALKDYPQLEVIATLQGDWTEPTAYKQVKEWNLKHPDTNINLVFGMNDRSAIGARKAFSETQKTLPLFCGIDGLPGENGGIQQVRDSLLEASYIYPTHGDQLLQLALDILDGKPYTKETSLVSALVTRDNARVLQLESEEVTRLSKNVEQLHLTADSYLQQLASQRLFTLFSFAFIILLLMLAFAFYLYNRQKKRILSERQKLEREQLNFYTQVSHELRTPLTLIEGPLTQLAETEDLQNASKETTNMLAIVRRNTRQLTQLINKMLEVQVGGFQEASNTKTDDSYVTKEISTESAPNILETDQPQDTSVLIVDDNNDIREYLRTILQEKYQVFEAEDGQKGLALAQEQVPDIIISDVMMPVMNGLEFCQNIKMNEITSHIPVILLTARALNSHQIEGYKSGADAYITKPFQPDLLLARIGNLLRNRHLLKDLWGTSSNALKKEDKTATTIENTPISTEGTRENAFISRFKKVVEERMTDSELSVETIGSELGLSRVQLYRKVKALTGSSPVDLLRKARLNKAQQLLQTTDLSVSEIAYQVGFTSPSYFTKCYKDEYGKVPGESRK
ncbi:MAG: substrate-binding domain-containing protein [Prevotella sp.]|nr:substrate-binding domain-containing protein [Prevotella sp.]